MNMSKGYTGIASFAVILIFLFISAAEAAMIIVDSADDIALPSINGDCTLREAIKAAETDLMVDLCAKGDGVDTIEFSALFDNPAGSSISLQANLSDFDNRIQQGLTINGHGIGKPVIDGGGTFQLFYLDSVGNDQSFGFTNMTMKGGLTPFNGGAIRISRGDNVIVEDMNFDANTATNGGGAIFMRSFESDSLTQDLTIRRCTFAANRAMGAANGGAIRAGLNHKVIVENSVFIGNIADVSGGAIYMASSFGPNPGQGELSILRSTFSANTANQGGGAIVVAGGNLAPLNASIMHSTIVANISDLDMDNVSDHDGGGIKVGASVTLTVGNTIIAENIDNSIPDNIDQSDISLAVSATPSILISNGFNFIGSNASVSSQFQEGFPNLLKDYVGSNDAKISPNLDPLGDYGGPTLSYRPALEGPFMVVDKGSCTGEMADQRGLSNEITSLRILDRDEVDNGPASDGCDIGAIELYKLTPQDEMCVPIKVSNNKIAVVCL